MLLFVAVFTKHLKLDRRHQDMPPDSIDNMLPVLAYRMGMVDLESALAAPGLGLLGPAALAAVVLALQGGGPLPGT